jgi:cytochrome b6-f complex iron-sulfur subunit
MKEKNHLSRRGFIQLSLNFLYALSGLLGLSGLVRFFSYQFNPSPPSEFDLGDVAAFPIGSRTVRPDIPAVIYNQAGDFVAYSLTCTHLGCTVEEDDDVFVCPCHGSRYDQEGKVLKGPAQKPLKRLRVEVLEDHTLRLYTDRDKK